MATRRHFLIASALGALAPTSGSGQSRPPRVGILAPFRNTLLAPAILHRLAELGYRDGAGMQLEFRSADGIEGLYPNLARELIDAKCDVIFALGVFPSNAFRDARRPLPIVFIAIDYDPLETGIVHSLSRPGGSMTGVYAPAVALSAKRFEIAMEVLPAASRFLVLSDVHSKDQLEALKRAANARRVQLVVVEFEKPPYDLAAAFETGRSAGVHAFIAFSTPVLGGNRVALGKLIVKHQLPAFVPTFMSSEPGFLLAYSYDFQKLGHRAAEMGVRILKGAKPADIPVEQPTEYELVVNLKTAKALGVKIPYSVMARATKVVE
jgi:putative ABC transport system substrate-binding protein